MKLAVTFATSLVVLGLCASGMVFAQRGGPGGGGPQGRFYDPKTVETVSGEILGLDTFSGRHGMAGVHANLKTDKGETIPVHLGPAWYLDKQSVTLKQGDKVTVRGSRITFDGKPAIIAAEVTRQGQTLRLRDDNGVPVWAGGRRRGQ
jgi:hypothetical protein